MAASSASRIFKAGTAAHLNIIELGPQWIDAGSI
jgi:hypothetical protein